MRWRRRVLLKAGRRPRRITARRSSTTSPKTSRPALDEFASRIKAMTEASKAKNEVEASIQRLFSYGAWADKYDGSVHSPPLRGVALAMNEPLGVVGVICPDEAPLLGFISLVAPLIAMGNRVVVVPSERYPLAATDLYQVLETSDVPAGVINIVTGGRDSSAQDAGRA